MKILIVCREGVSSRPYITEQANALKKQGVGVEYYFIGGDGIKAYFLNYIPFRAKLKEFSPDIVHAHYGLSGLFANFQHSVPVITTFHGSDVNFRTIRPFSLFAARFSRYNIFVSNKLSRKLRARKKYAIQPCGVDFDTFYPVEKQTAREKMKLDPAGIYVLFSGSFKSRIKNVVLANSAINILKEKVYLIELSGYGRKEVNLLFNACDVALMTSLMEGSPQFIKEAMACNCPIVSTNVGSVEEIIDNTEGCYLTSFDPDNVSEKLKQAIAFGKRTNGHQKISHLDNDIIAEKIISVYKSVLK